MKICFITPSPPNSLNRIRSKNIIISLFELGHEITLVSLIKNRKEQKTLEHMKPYVKEFVGVKQPVWLSVFQCFFGLFLPIPLRVSYCYCWNLRRELKKGKYNNFDAIYIKRLRMAQYAKAFIGRGKVFIDLTDSMTKYYQRLKIINKGFSKMLATEEYHKHKLYEPKICNKYKNIIICSQDDKHYLVKNFGCIEGRFYVMENGVNLDEWKYQQRIVKDNLSNLVFWGVMNVETNILSCKFFIKKVMPLLQNKYTFSVIGPKPGPELTRYSSARIMFKGYVDNIYKVLSNMGIFVCPIVSGAGMNNKIIQASLIGMPIVSTSLGVEGVINELKENIFIADNPQVFVGKINHILNMDEEALKSLRAKQERVVKEYYDVRNIVKRFSDTFLI